MSKLNKVKVIPGTLETVSTVQTKSAFVMIIGEFEDELKTSELVPLDIFQQLYDANVEKDKWFRINVPKLMKAIDEKDIPRMSREIIESDYSKSLRR